MPQQIVVLSDGETWDSDAEIIVLSDKAFESLTWDTKKVKDMTDTEMLFRQPVSNTITAPVTLNDLANLVKRFLPDAELSCQDDGNITIITNLTETEGFLTSI